MEGVRAGDQLAVRSQWLSVPSPPVHVSTGATTNETKEVKEKLDKEFKEKTEKLQEKLKTEQAYAKWTYVVSKWTVDNLLKERKDLLAEKKEEPKKDETKPADAKPAETKPAESKPADAKKPESPGDSLVPK